VDPQQYINCQYKKENGCCGPLDDILTLTSDQALQQYQLQICSRNRVWKFQTSKIHYPVPSLGNWYQFFALITDETDIGLVMDDDV